MAAVKQSSTIQQNKRYALNECPVTYVMNKIGSYWKPIIIYHLSQGDKRYNELKKAIPAITEKMLIQHLKQLENDGLVLRESKPVVPPHVTYKLSKSGKGLFPVIEAMAIWAMNENKGAYKRRTA